MSASTLGRWYASQCNGEWEHLRRTHRDTLDNPGWSVQIDLSDTRRRGGVLEKKKIDRTETDWVLCWAAKQQFCIACGPLNLSEAAETFVQWFDSESG